MAYCTWHTPVVAGMYYTPAMTKALPREGGIGSCDCYRPSTSAQALQC